MSNTWRYEFCDVFSSFPDCLIGCCVPQVEAGLASYNYNQDWLWAGLQCFFFPCLVPLLRNQVREAKGIEGSIVGDLATGWCCPCCTSIQIKREFD